MTRRLWILAAAIVATLAACYPAEPDGTCAEPADDRVFVDDGEHPTGLWCFDDGDGYPTIYPPITSIGYPVTGG